MAIDMHETGEWQSQKCMNAFVSSDEVLDIGIAMLQAILTDALLSMPRIGPSMRLSVGDCICKELLQMKVEKETLS